MPVPNNITDLSTTPAANSPAGSESPQLIDDYLRTQGAFIAQLRDEAKSRSFAVAAAGGTADAITATFSPAVTSLTNGMTLYVRAALANTTSTPTFSPNGLAATTIVRANNQPLTAGDIAGAGHWLELQYDTTLSKWVLQNPSRTDLATKASVGLVGLSPSDARKLVVVKADGTGYELLTPPAFSVHPTVNQAIGASTVTKVVYGAKEFDTASSFDLSTSRIKPSISGYYQITCNLFLSGSMVNTYINFMKNGVLYQQSPYVASGWIMQGASALVYFNGTTDYMEIHVSNQNACTVGGSTGPEYSRLSGFLVAGA